MTPNININKTDLLNLAVNISDPPPDPAGAFSVSVVRPDDMLILSLHFSRLKLTPDRKIGITLAPEDPPADALIVVGFPPQSMANTCSEPADRRPPKSFLIPTVKAFCTASAYSIKKIKAEMPSKNRPFYPAEFSAYTQNVNSFREKNALTPNTKSGLVVYSNRRLDRTRILC